MKINSGIMTGVVLFAIILAAVPADAQTPAATATPLPPGATTWIPEQAPANWRGTESEWTALRKHCVDIFADARRRIDTSPTQRKNLPEPKYSHRDFIDCANLSLEFTPGARGGTIPKTAISPVPMPHPPPAYARLGCTAIWKSWRP